MNTMLIRLNHKKRSRKALFVMGYGLCLALSWLVITNAVAETHTAPADTQQVTAVMSKKAATKQPASATTQSDIKQSAPVEPKAKPATAKPAAAATNILKSIRFNALPNDVLQVRLQFSKALTKKPRSFITHNPSRIIVDLEHVKNGTGKFVHLASLNPVNKIMTVESDKRFRVVIDLSSLVKYKTRIHGDSLYINIQSEGTASYFLDKKKRDYGGATLQKPNFKVKNIDFRRNGGTGRVIIDLSSPNVSADVVQEGKSIIVNFPRTALPKRLQRRLDVTDFGTPVNNVDTMQKDNSVQITINSEGAYEQLAYQIGSQFFVDVKALTPQEKEEKQRTDPEYTGKRLSLNFQNVKVRSVLQLLAEFTGFNIVVSDSVNGDLTLRLTEVPWDQALDIILQTQGLGKQQVGNVMLIGPMSELAAREKQEFEVLKQVESLAPLQSELIQLNYAKAEDMVQLLKARDNSILSGRGTATFDTRTNNLWVQDTSSQLTKVREFVKRLDKPVRQVLIEARIVEVEKNYEEDLGVRFGVSNTSNNISGSLDAANSLSNGADVSSLNVDKRLNVNFPVNNALTDATPTVAGQTGIGIALARIGRGTFLDLELSALEKEGRANIVSAPRVITADKQKARIEDGQEIPYQEASSSGATSTSFKKAVLSLEVTPQITPDDRIIMELDVHKDSPTSDVSTSEGEPGIDTRSVKTNVLVKNGETIVLGGIYTKTKRLNVTKTPFLGDLPVLGYLFRQRNEVSNRNELLVFITPKIIMQEEPA